MVSNNMHDLDNHLLYGLNKAFHKVSLLDESVIYSLCSFSSMSGKIKSIHVQHCI